MSHRISKPARPVPVKRPDHSQRHAALHRAQAAAQAASARADAAWLDSMHPVHRADELRRREDAAHLSLAEIETTVGQAAARDASAQAALASVAEARRLALAPLVADAEKRLVDFDFDAAIAADISIDHVRRDYAAAVEVHRSTTLLKMAEFAAQHQVSFDAAALVADGTSLEVAREALQEMMANRSEGLHVNGRVPHASAQQASTSAGWGAALARVMERQGLSAGTGHAR